MLYKNDSQETCLPYRATGARPRQGGTVLIVAMVAMVLMVGFSIAYVQVTNTQSNQVNNTVDYDTVCQTSKSGIEMAKVSLVMGHDYVTATPWTVDDSISSGELGWDDELQASDTNLAYFYPSEYGEVIGTDATQFKWAWQFDYHDSLYVATITDNDDGDSNLLDDIDDMVVLTVTATQTAGVTASVMQALVRYKPPVYEPDTAITTGGSLKLSGASTVDGDQGSVYAAEDVIISGSASVLKEVYAGGSITGEEDYDGQFHAGAPAPDVPSISPSAYASLATYLLDTDGKVYTATTMALVGDASVAPVLGWDFNGTTWRCNSDDPTNGTFYVPGEMNVDISGNPGTIDPWQVTLLVTGAVDITGTPVMTPHSEGVVIMASGDISIHGNLTVLDGLVATHQQMSISGSVDITGVVVAEASALGSPGIDVTLSGNASITYNGGITTFLEYGDPYIKIMGYKQLK